MSNTVTRSQIKHLIQFISGDCGPIKMFSADLNNLLENVIKGKLDDFLIESSDSDVGEGFNGEVKIITLTDKWSKEIKSFAVKQQNFDTPKHKKFTSPLFENEIFFYTVLWPTLDKFYQETTDKSLNIIAKCLGTSNGTCKKIVMENVLAENFRSYPTGMPFDEEHFIKIFETCGVLHGISMALKEVDEAKFSQMLRCLHQSWKTLFTGKDFLSKSLTRTTGAMQYLFDPKTEQHIINKLKEYQKCGFDLVYKALNKDPPARVFLHGDCWKNNFMFKYDVSTI